MLYLVSMDLVVDNPSFLQLTSLWGLFPLITFVINMMYLQIIYTHEALQIPKMINKKCYNWPVNKWDMASQKSHVFPMGYNICTDKLITCSCYCTFLMSKVICTFWTLKGFGFSFSSYKAKVNMNRVYHDEKSLKCLKME